MIKDYFKGLSISVQLYTIALATVIVIFLVVFFTYSKFSEVIQINNAKSYEALITQIRQSQQNEFDTIGRLIFNAAYNDTVQSFVSETDPLKQFELYQQLKLYLLSNILSVNEGILDIAIIGNTGTKINVLGTLDDEMLQKIDQIAAQSPRKKVFYSDLTNYAGTPCFLAESVIYQIRDVNHFGENIGKVVFIVKAKSLSGGLTKSQSLDEPRIYMMDRNYKIFASNQPDIPGTSFTMLSPEMVESQEKNRSVRVKNEPYTVNTADISAISGSFVSLIPRKSLSRELSNIRWLEILIYLSAIILLSIPFSFIIGNILASFKKLLSFMNRLKQGDLSKLKQRLHLDGFAEISVVANHFNAMLNDLSQLTNELVDSNTKMLKLELDKKSAQYEALKSQINPHFLYNTLESIRGLAVKYDAGDIREVAKSLGQILRYSIKGDDKVRFKDEWQIVEAYMAIQAYRFQNRFEFRMDIDPLALEVEIPKMILQPLVENALFHGLEPKMGKGVLQVKANIRMDELVIEIKDDGVGFPKDVFEIVSVKLSSDLLKDDYVSEHGKSIGILNVHRRIQLKYGNRYGIRIQSSPSIGTSIMVHLPTGGASHV